MSTRTDSESYLDQLRHELADLPGDEVNEIVQDLEPQLVAIVGELGAESSPAALADRLGTPAEYARELRSAMDVPDAPGAQRPSDRLPRTVLWVLVGGTAVAAFGGWAVSSGVGWLWLYCGVVLLLCAVTVYSRPAVDEVAALPEVRLTASLLTSTEKRRRVVGYLRSLWPAWLLVSPFLVWLGVVWQFRQLGWWDAWPEVFGTGFAALAIVANYRAPADRRWLWLCIPLSGWAFGVAVKMTELLPQLLGGDYIWD